MLKKLGSVAVIAVAIAGCATQAETIGTAGGVAVGSAISGNSTVGTIAGGVLGHEIGHAYDQHHR